MYFSIHASAKEATTVQAVSVRNNRFSIHASAKEATSKSCIVTRDYRFSIHASAKEATFSSCSEYRKKNIFNPRLREGGDQRIRSNTTTRLIFNPRLREGGDVFFDREVHLCCVFSIHASAKEATRFDHLLELAKNFQSTPPRRRRPQHIVIPQLSCAYLVSTTFLSTIFSFISQYIVLFPLFRVRMPCVFCVAYDSHYVPLFNIFYILFQGTPF